MRERSEIQANESRIQTWRALAVALAGVLWLIAAGCGSDPSAAPVVADASEDGRALDPGDPDLPEPPGPPEPLPPPAPTPEPMAEIRRLCFSPREDCVGVLLSYLQSETQGIDIAIYHLYDTRISNLLVQKKNAGVKVRVLADRFAYTIKPQHRREMDFLASQGVEVRTNRHRGLVHHKLTIMHGENLVLHGSMNYTSVASRKVTTDGVTQWNEETAFITNDDRFVTRFKERFDRMWENTDPNRKAFQPFTVGTVMASAEEDEANPPLTCYEDPVPDPKPLPDARDLEVCFSPDQSCNTEVIAPIIRGESSRIDMFVFRITVSSVADPLLEKVKAGVPIRLVIERSQYNNPLYPSMTRILNDLWAANTRGNLKIRATAHAGSMHMKSVITPDVATWASGNFTFPSSRRVRGCTSVYYQDEDLAVTRDPDLVREIQARFDELWASQDFTDIVPASPVPAPVPSPSPTSGPVETLAAPASGAARP